MANSDERDHSSDKDGLIQVVNAPLLPPITSCRVSPASQAPRLRVPPISAQPTDLSTNTAWRAPIALCPPH